MKFTESPILDGDGKRIIIQGISNFGKGSFDKTSACHYGVISGKYIGKLNYLTLTKEILNGKEYVLPNSKRNEGFPVQVYEN